MQTTLKRLMPAFLISGIFSLGVSAFGPFLAPYLSNAGFSNSSISYINSFGTLLIILLIPLVGKLSDNIGRKKVVALSLIMEVLSIIFLLDLPKSFLLVSLIVALQVSMGYAVALALLTLVEDGLKKRSRGFFTGLNESIYSIGVVTGPLIGALIVAGTSINIIFKFSLVIFVLLLFLLPLLKEPDHQNQILRMKDFSLFKELRSFWQNKKLKGLGILGIFMHFASPIHYVFLPLFIVQELKAPLKFVGIITAFSVIANLFQFCHGWLCDKKGCNKMIVLGSLLSAIALLGIMVSSNIQTLIIMVVVHSIGISLWNTSALCYMSEIGEEMKKEGQIVGSYASIAKCGAFFSYLISGYLVSVMGIRFLFLIYSVLIMSAILISLKYIFEKPLRSPLFEKQADKLIIES